MTFKLKDNELLSHCVKLFRNLVAKYHNHDFNEFQLLA